MNIDRNVQKRLLEQLSEAYPASIPANQLAQPEVESPDLVANAHYLYEHGLLDGNFSSAIGSPKRLSSAKITARGMDFLADDGGLTAILGVVTVRLEAETVRLLMEAKIQESELPKHEKARLLDTLRLLPGEGLKELTRQLVQAGIQYGPDVVSMLGKLHGP